MEKKDITNVQVLYREWGNYITIILEQYSRALTYYNKSYEKNPLDTRALLGRAWALSKVVSYEEALLDVNKAIELAPDNLIARAHKALITYLTCEFEEALVQNTRLIPLRKKPENFVMGVMHCTEAIQNCLGERCGRPLRDHFKIIRRLAWKEHFESLKPYTAKAKLAKPKRNNRKKQFKDLAAENKLRNRKSKTTPVDGEEKCSEILDSLHSTNSEDNYIPPFTNPFPYKPLQNYTKNIKNYMAEKYLDCMYLDKIYLQKIRMEKGIKSPNYKGTLKIKSLAKIGYKTVCYKQELLRTRRPFYYLKYHEVQSTGELKSRQEKQFELLQDKATKYADKRMRTINNALASKDWKLVLNNTENLMIFCEKTPKKLLRNRDMYMSAVYTSVCNAHYDMKRLNPNKSDQSQKKRIMVTFGMTLTRTLSKDSVIQQFRDNIVDFNKQIDVYLERMKKAQGHEELVWIYHELSRLYSETKQYEISRMYAKKCLTEAQICENNKWAINALTLIIRAHVQQSHKNDAKNEILRAIDISTQMVDPVVTAFMTKALEVIHEMNFEEVQATKELEKREKKIVGLMPDSAMQSEAAHLFRMLATMPANRRMSVMPGIKIEDSEQSKKRQTLSLKTLLFSISNK